MGTVGKYTEACSHGKPYFAEHPYFKRNEKYIYEDCLISLIIYSLVFTGCPKALFSYPSVWKNKR